MGGGVLSQGVGCILDWTCIVDHEGRRAATQRAALRAGPDVPFTSEGGEITQRCVCVW